MIFTAAEDGFVKVWDRRNGQVVNQFKHGSAPIFSLDTNKQIVCGGTKGEIVFWDLRKMKELAVFSESHTDDITAVKFHPQNPNWMLSCAPTVYFVNLTSLRKQLSPKMKL